MTDTDRKYTCTTCGQDVCQSCYEYLLFPSSQPLTAAATSSTGAQAEDFTGSEVISDAAAPALSTVRSDEPFNERWELARLQVRPRRRSLPNPLAAVSDNVTASQDADSLVHNPVPLSDSVVADVDVGDPSSGNSPFATPAAADFMGDTPPDPCTNPALSPASCSGGVNTDTNPERQSPTDCRTEMVCKLRC